jgi:Abnormal spindle-like microcephaly-assoc'd, ASPM-SPD-2-Hydin
MYKRRTPWRRASAAPVVAALAATALLAPSAHAGDAPKIAFDKSAYDFGTVANGSSAAQTVTLRNSGGSATGGLTLALSGPGAARYSISDDTCTVEGIGPKKSCTLTVTYTPSAAGASDTATLTAKSKKTTAATAALSGKSSPAASADISLDVGGEFCFVCSRVVTATNNGPAAATVTVRVATESNIGCTVTTIPPITGWSTSPIGSCGRDYTSLQPIASGSSLTFSLEKLVPGGHAEVWWSSLPDPDSTPGNGDAGEDDYFPIGAFNY